MHEQLEREFGILFSSQLQKMLVRRADKKVINKDFLDRAISIRYNDCVALNLRAQADNMINAFRQVETNDSFLERIIRNFE